MITVLLVVLYTTRILEHNGIVPADKINPNNASAASLSRLPGVGMVRAEAILAYRREFTSTSDKPAFENYKDLEKVHGIGPKTTQKINKWLKFE
jgi:competence ComEA-like helix-hairpin-helix protein